MKRILPLLLLCLLCTACRSAAKLADTTAPDETAVTSVPAEQYVRTGGIGGSFPRTLRIDSPDELADYLAAADSPALRTAAEDYDSAFFADCTLLLILLEEPSGAIRHIVTDVDTADSGALTVTIDRSLPGDATDDMAYWHILLPLPRSFGGDEVNLVLNDHTVVSEEDVRCLPVGLVDTAEAQAFVIASTTELEGWSFAHGLTNSPAFRDALAAYDDEFFAQSNLAIITLPADSSMRRWRVDSVEWYWSVEEDHGGYNIRIAGLYPDGGEVTADLLPQTLLFPLPGGELAAEHLHLTLTHGTY